LQHFSVLRHRQVRVRFAEAFRLPPVPPGIGVDTSAAREVSASDGVTVWVIPGSGGLCMLATKAPDTNPEDVACTPTPSALGGEAFLGFGHGSAGDSFVGVAPDGTATAELTHPNGTTTTVPVTNNVWSVAGLPAGNGSTAPITHIVLKTAQGRVSANYPVGF
jgi:hypothetical protein